MEGVVAQTEAGLTRILLDELLAFQTASGEALNGARHWANTLYESMVFAVGDVATLLGRLRGGNTPSPRAVQRSARRSLRRSTAELLLRSVLRGTRQFVTWPKELTLIYHFRYIAG